MWRQIALLIFSLGTSVLIVFEFTRAGPFLRAIADVRWYWMTAAVLLFAFSFYLNALLYRFGLLAGQVSSTTRTLISPLFVSQFLSVALPFGEVIFIEYARERGQSGARAAAGATFVLMVNLVTTLPFLVWGLVYLSARGKLAFYDVLLSVFFFIYTALLVAGLWLAKRKPEWLQAALRAVQRATNALLCLLRRSTRVKDQWVEGSTQQVGEASGSMKDHPGLLGLNLVVALVFHLATVAGLYALLLAFGVRPSVGAVMIGFAMSIVLQVVAFTPHGVGPTEQVMAVVLLASGIASTTAVAVSILFRVFNIWIPVLVGYFLARRMPIFGGKHRA